MMNLIRPIATAAMVVLFSAPALADETNPTAAEVQDFVERMQAHVTAVGTEKAFADFSDTKGPWVKGQLYGFCHSLEGVSMAHGGNPALIGKNVLGFKDPDGTLVNVLIIDKAKADGKGWVEYKWPNALTKKITPKRVYIETVAGKYVCGSGYHAE